MVGMTNANWTDIPADVAAERSAIEAEIAGSTLLPAYAQTVAEHPGVVAHQWLADGQWQALTYQQVYDLVREAALGLAASHLSRRLPQAIATKKMTDQAASMGRLMGGFVGRRTTTIGWELTGASGGVWTEAEEDLGHRGTAFLGRQMGEIGGGTTEMARNVVAERLLGLPRG